MITNTNKISPNATYLEFVVLDDNKHKCIICVSVF